VSSTRKVLSLPRSWHRHVQVVRRIVPRDPAGAGVAAVLVVVPDRAVPIEDELQAEAVPHVAVAVAVVQHLWGQELRGALATYRLQDRARSATVTCAPPSGEPIGG
jgi:hypothetical protein